MLKKGKYKFIKTSYVNANDIYVRFKEQNAMLIKQYHRHSGHPMRFSNAPITVFASDYISGSTQSMQSLNDHIFIRYYCDFYRCYDREYKKRLVNRLIRVIESVRKHGYATGKYSKNLIGLCEGVNPYYGIVSTGYELISGKHRCAACIALGMGKIKCQIYRQVRE